MHGERLVCPVVILLWMSQIRPSGMFRIAGNSEGMNHLVRFLGLVCGDMGAVIDRGENDLMLCFIY